MAALLQSVKNCIYKTPQQDSVEKLANKSDSKGKGDACDEHSSDNVPYSNINKKTDETPDSNQGGILWRVSSGVYNTTTGAVGMGYNGAKWVAGKGYDIGSTAVSYVKVPTIMQKKKDKKE